VSVHLALVDRQFCSTLTFTTRNASTSGHIAASFTPTGRTAWARG